MGKINMVTAKFLKTTVILSLILLSILLTFLDWQQLLNIRQHLSGIGWVAVSLLITETFFIAGAVLMAISAGENLPPLRKWHLWPKHIMVLRRDVKIFAEKLLESRLFGLGFWLNFIGAVGTSSILIWALITFAPYTGLGVLVVILIDLIATFGWRIPLEISRRKARLHVEN